MLFSESERLYMHLLIEKINQHIQEAKSLLQDQPAAPTNFSTLKEIAVDTELKNLTQQLSKIISSSESIEDIRQKFKELCRARNKENAGSAFSFFIAPNSAPNKLCWDIGSILFNLSEQKEVLELFAPDVTKTVVMSGKVIDSNIKATNANNIKFNLKAELITPGEKADYDKLSQYVVIDDILFDLSLISKMPLEYLQSFVNQLEANRKLRHILPAIFNHNQHLRELKEDISILNNEGQTVRQTIQEFIMKLRLSGQSITGKQFASNLANIAFTDFLAYIKKLPSDYRETLLCAIGLYGISIQKVIDRLSQENCVEEAATYLESILNNSANNHVLDISVGMTAHTKNEMKQKYYRKITKRKMANQYESASKRRKINDDTYETTFTNEETGEDALITNGLPDTADDIGKRIPEQVLIECLQKLKIEYGEDLLTLLINFSPSHYSMLIKYCAGINHNLLISYGFSTIIANGTLGNEKTQAIIQAVIENRAKFNSLSSILINWEVDFVEIMKLRPQRERLSMLNTEDVDGRTLLNNKSSDCSKLQAILELLLEDERIAAIKHKDKHGRTLLHNKITQKDSSQYMLDLLPEKERIKLLKEKDDNGRTALHYAGCNNLDIIPNLLKLYPQCERIEALIETDNEDKTPLSYVTKRANFIDILPAILSLLPDGHKLDLLWKDEISSQLIVEVAKKRPEKLVSLLNLYPENDRLNVVKNTEEILQHIAAYPETLEFVLNLYPEAQRLAVVKKRVKNNFTLLDFAKNNEKSLNIVLELYPEEERLEAVTAEYQFFGQQSLNKFLRFTLSTPGSLNTILNMLTEKERKTEANRTDDFGRTLLHYAAESSCESLSILMGLYQPCELLEAVTKEDYAEYSVLKYALNNKPESLDLILKSLPENAKLDAIIHADERGHTYIERLAEKPEHLKVALSQLSSAQRQKALLHNNVLGFTALNKIINNKESFEVLCALISHEQLVELALSVDKEGFNILHRTANNFYYLKLILDKFDKADYIKILKVKDKNGYSALKHAASNHLALEDLMNFLPYSQRQEAARHVLQFTVDRPMSMAIVLEHLDESERLAAIKTEDKNGYTVFKHTANNHLVCGGNTVDRTACRILALLPQKDRLKAVVHKNSHGQSLIDYMGKTIEAIGPILKLLPEKDRLAAVTYEDNCGFTFMIHIALNPINIDDFINFLPEKDRISALSHKDNIGTPIIIYAAMKPVFLPYILKKLPRKARVEALKIKAANGCTALHLVREESDCLKKIIRTILDTKQFASFKQENPNLMANNINGLIQKLEQLCSYPDLPVNSSYSPSLESSIYEYESEEDSVSRVSRHASP